MSITSVVNDTVTSVSLLNAQKPLPPTISSYSVGGLDDTALDPAGGQTVQINGTGFLAGATITFDGNAVAVVTYVNPNRLTFTSPAKSAGTYTIYVVNPDGGTAIYIPGIIYSVLPTWTTSAGTLGSYYETTSISNTVVASGDAPITYSLYSGSLPTGATLAANGVITGTAPVDSSSTTYSFTIEAIDAQLQGSTRSFSLTINTDVVTWVSPANATTYTSAVDSAIANVTLSATDAAGYGIVYTANALPTGLSLSGNTISGTPTVVADSSTLLTATANTTSRTATRTINWSITVANDPYFEYNTLLIPGASTTFVDDASTNNFAVTVVGDTKPNSSNPYTPGYYSNYFDGTGDYLQKVSPPTYLCDWTTTNFTIEYWIYAAAFGSGANGGSNVLGNVNDAGDGEYWSFGTISTGAVRFYYYNGSQNSFTTSTTLSANKWYHLAFVNNGGSLTIYIDGVSSATSTKAGTPQFSSAIAFSIGKCTGSAFNGYISNLRIVQSAVYTSNFTPTTSPLTAISGTQLLTSQSNRIIDNSTNNVAFTVYGDTSVKSFDPFLPNSSYSSYGSGYFDGTGDVLTVPDSNAFALGSSNFTMEAWIYPTATGNYPTIAAQYGAAINSSFFWSLGPTANPRDVYVFFYVSGNTFTLQASNVVVLNTWSHHAVVRNSTTLTYYINGVSVSTTSIGSSALIDSTRLFTIGNSGDPDYTSYPFTGYITDVRVVNGTAVYTSAFTPPATPLTAIANTSLLTLQNNQSVNNNVFLDNSTNNFLVTRVGNTTQGTFSPYGGNWSNYFTGSSYLNAGTTASNFLCTGSATGITATFEAWVFPIAYSTGASTWMFSPIHAKGATYFNFGVRNGAVRFYWFDGGYKNVDSTSTNDVPLNTWTHVAVTISASTIKIYVNGVLNITSATYTGIATAGANQIEYIGVEGNAPTYFSGYISNYRLNSTVVYSAAFTPSTTPLTVISGTNLLTCQSNSFIYNNTIPLTVTGATTVQRFNPFNPSIVTPTSYSGYFDGTTDYLTLSQQTALSFGTGDFTVEAWVYPTAMPAAPGLFWSLIDARGSVAAIPWAAGLRTVSGNLKIEFYSGVQTQGSITVPLNSWTHIAFARSETTFRGFVNGVVDINTTLTTNLNIAAGTQVIGAYIDPGYNTGYISNFRIVKGTAVYTSTFTPPTQPLTAISGTSLLTCQSTTFIDNSTNNYTITVVGDSKPTIQNPFGYISATTQGYTTSTIGGSGYFDGTDYLSIPDNQAFNFTGNFTIECWVYPTSHSATVYLIGQTSSTDYAPVLIYLANGRPGISVSTTGNTWIINAAVATALALNSWSHIAVVRSGNKWSIYVNGVENVIAASTSGTPYNSTDPLGIGGEAAGPFNYPYLGYLSDVRIINGQAIYTSNFVPSSSPLTAIQNTVLLSNMTGAGIYDASMMNNLETVGDAKLSTAVSKFGGSSMSFDGTGDYLISSPNAAVLNTFGTGDFTVEFWMNSVSFANVNNEKIVFDCRPLSTDGLYPCIYFFSGQIRYFVNSADRITGSTLNTGQWYHVALARSGSSTKLFVDGTQVGSTYTDTNNYLCGANRPIIASRGHTLGEYNYNGYIDDLRITKGYARYTSNFTPPALPFPIF